MQIKLLLLPIFGGRTARFREFHAKPFGRDGAGRLERRDRVGSEPTESINTSSREIFHTARFKIIFRATFKLAPYYSPILMVCLDMSPFFVIIL